MVDYEALVMLLKERGDLKAVVECIGSDGAPLSSVIECVVSKGVVTEIHKVRNRVRYLAQYKVVEVLRVGRKTYLRLDKEFARYLKKAEKRGRSKKS